MKNLTNNGDLYKNAPNQFLTNTEEDEIIDQIEKAHMNSNCLSGKDIREIAQEIFYYRIN